MSLEQEPKPSGFLMSKLITIAVVLVCFGAVLFAADYLAGVKIITEGQPDVLYTPKPVKVIDKINWKTYNSSSLAVRSFEIYKIDYPLDWSYSEKRASVIGYPDGLETIFKNNKNEKIIRIGAFSTTANYQDVKKYNDPKNVYEVNIGSSGYVFLRDGHSVFDDPMGSSPVEVSYMFNVRRNKNLAYSPTEQNEIIMFRVAAANEPYLKEMLSTFKYIGGTPQGKIQWLNELMEQNLNFKSYMEEVFKKNPALNAKEFYASAPRAMDEKNHSYDFSYVPEDINDPKWIFSPDNEKAVSLYGLFGEPDSSFDLYNRNGDRKTENLLMCGTPCEFWAAYWLNNKQFVFIERVEMQISYDAGYKTKYAIDIYLYDIESNVKTVYHSQLLLESPVMPDTREWGERVYGVCMKVSQNEASCSRWAK